MPEHSVKYTKPFQNDQDEGDGAAVAVIGSNHGSATRSRRVKFVAFIVVILLILNVIFLALFLNDRHRYNECKKSLQGLSRVCRMRMCFVTNKLLDFFF